MSLQSRVAKLERKLPALPCPEKKAANVRSIKQICEAMSYAQIDAFEELLKLAAERERRGEKMTRTEIIERAKQAGLLEPTEQAVVFEKRRACEFLSHATEVGGEKEQEKSDELGK